MAHRPPSLTGPSVKRLLVLAGPLLWALLVLFHPVPGGVSPYEGVEAHVDRWLVVHVGQLILTPLLLAAVWTLLRDLRSGAAMVSRAALVVWTVFFSAYDSVQGVATGILARHASGVTGEEQTAFASAVDFLIEDSILAGDISAIQLVAGGAWLVVASSAAAALHLAGAGKGVVVAAGLSAVFAAHMAPAAIGLLALAVAGALNERPATRTRQLIRA